ETAVEFKERDQWPADDAARSRLGTVPVSRRKPAAMVTQLEDDRTVEAQALSTSLDPYGQLLKMLMPRSQCIVIHDHRGLPLWTSDGCASGSLAQLLDETLND